MSDLPAVASSSAVAAMLTKNKVTPTAAGGGAFIRYDAKRTGEWVFGMDAEPVTGDVFSLDVLSLKHGYHLWHAKKCSRRMAPLDEELPEPQEPVHYTDAKGKPQVDEPSEARYFEGTFEDGVKFHFETCSFGGRKAVDSVLEELFTRAAAGSEYLFPQVQLETDSYVHDTYGKVYNPVLTAVAWFNDKGEAEPAAAEQLAAPVVEPEPEPAEEPAPKRRRRARA